MDPFIIFDRVSYRYESSAGAPIPALNDVSLSISEGEWVAVAGANGSGKSTFARLISALLVPQSGEIRVGGYNTRESVNQGHIHALVGMVFQFPEDQIISTTVEEDVAFGPENLGMPPDKIRAQVRSALDAVDMWEHRLRPPHLLSAGQTQRVALAGVLAMNPRCIVFDEASTMIDPAGRRMLAAAMEQLHRAGTTIISITHFMEETAAADRLIVFEHGRVALDGTPAQVFSDPGRLSDLRLDLPPVTRAGAALHASFPIIPENALFLSEILSVLPDFPGATRMPPVQSTSSDTSTMPVIEVAGLGYTYMRGTPLAQRALDNANLRVDSGQAHGLVGMTGSGKSTLMQHLNALIRPQEGQVRVQDFNLNDPHIDRRQVVRKVGMVFQNPETQFFEHFVGDEIAYGPRQLKVEEPLRERVRKAMTQVGLDFDTYKDRPLFALSGGERRKVAIASTLALKPSLLLLDEPTAGLDPCSRRDLLNELIAMRDAGMTLVLSSHQMGDLARLARDLTVFQRGHDVLSGSTEQVFNQADILRQYSLEPPVAAQVAAALREKGWPLPLNVLTAEALQEAVAQALQEVGNG